MEMSPTKNSEDLEKWYPCFRDHGIQDLYLDKWFGNYDMTIDAQREAFDIVLATYKTPKPMVFLGKFGGGKTHLATAIVKNTLMAHNEAYYYTLTGLFRDYRRSLNDPDFPEYKFFRNIHNAKVLVIDEINIRSDSAAENRVIQELVDVRYAKKLQTIFIANMNQEEFSEVITERLVERLKEHDAEIIMFTWESHRGK